MPSLGRRLAARLIDCWLLLFTLASLWGFGFRAATSDCNGVSRCEGFSALGITLLVVVIGAAATLLYDILSLAFWATTIGKSACGLRVTTRLDGSPPDARQCEIRAIAFGLQLVLSLYWRFTC